MDNSLRILTHLDSWQVTAVIVKALTYGMSFAAAGGILFTVLFSSMLTAEESRTIRRFSVCVALLSIVLSVLRVSVISAQLNGDWSGMLDQAMIKMVLQTSEGSATGLRLIGLVLLVVGSAVKPRIIFGSTIALLGAVLSSLSFAWVGHAGEVAQGTIAQGLLSIHLLAVTFWLGALWPLHRITYGSDLKKIAAIMHRFGKIAALIVGMLLTVGALLLWLLLGHLGLLWSSGYGNLFLVKLGLVALLLGLATLNKLRLTPCLLQGDHSVVKTLRTSIKTEIVVAVLILVASATLTTVIGPEEHANLPSVVLK